MTKTSPSTNRVGEPVMLIDHTLRRAYRTILARLTHGSLIKMQRAGETSSRHVSRLEFAAKLLGVASIETVASAVLARAMLPDGRFEAHEFGRNEHSTSSAGALIVGIAGIQQLPDQLLHRPMSCAAALVDAAGNIRGHDDHPNIGSTSWSISQLIFGLLQRYSLVSRTDR